MKTLITYFKTRAVKQISQWLVIAALSILLSGAFAVADAYAAFTLPGKMDPKPIIPLITTVDGFECADLQGKSAGTCDLDAGCMDFENDPPSASLAAEICAPNEPFVNDELQDFELHGWVWDPNLGYISLHCDENGNNNGVKCGSIEYGVKLDLETGEMYGWAWGDNLGWISFGCEDGLNQGYACGSVDYSVNANVVIDEDLGKFNGYAWADTVGWFDFDGLEAKMLQLMLKEGGDEDGNETQWGVWTKAEISSDGTDSAPTKATAPFADGSDKYDLFLHIADINGIPANPDDVTISVETVWTDTVRWDQTTNGEGNYNDNNGGPVGKPNILPPVGNDFAYVGGAIQPQQAPV